MIKATWLGLLLAICSVLGAAEQEAVSAPEEDDSGNAKSGKELSPDGKTETTYKGGQLISEISVKDGVYDGPFTFYFPQNGKKCIVGRHRNGKYEGRITGYQVNGKVAYIHHMKDGKMHGLCKEFDKEGVIKSEGHYRNGIPVDVHKEYDAKGKVIREVTYNRRGAVVKNTDKSGGIAVRMR